jgi:hypothetical protein
MSCNCIYLKHLCITFFVFGNFIYFQFWVEYIGIVRCSDEITGVFIFLLSGINSELINLQADTQEEELLTVIEQLNNDDNIDGILVQLPVPDHITEKRVNISIINKGWVTG